MMGDTHQKLGVSAAAVLCAATSAPLSGAAAIVLSAARWSSTPDRMEKRFGAGHREWTHWLSACVLTAVAPVAVVVLVLLLASSVMDHGWSPTFFDDTLARVPLVLHRVDLVAHGHRWHGTPGEFAMGLALIVGSLVALGRTVGMCMHTLADACTPHGSPLWGLPGVPRSQRPVHLLPRWARVKTASVDDTSVGVWALGLTVLVVWVSLRGLVLPTLPHS